MKNHYLMLSLVFLATSGCTINLHPIRAGGTL
ncbi:hypothetical protein VPHK45_0067 [Vibrio phage K45]